MEKDKRKYGSGGLWRRGRVWWIKYYVDRYPIFESAKTRDKKRAEDFLRQRLAEAELDQLPKPGAGRLTVRDLLKALLSDYELRGRASKKQFESRMRVHLLPLLGSVRAQDFGNRHIDAYVRQRRHQGASDAAINRELEHVRAAFKFAVDNEELSKAPKIRMLAEDNVRTGFLEHSEYLSLRHVMPQYLVPLFVVGYHVGSRLGELLKLRWDQVDFEASQIWLERGQTKAKVARVLPIYGEMREVLVGAFKERNEKHPKCELIFNRNGRQIADFRKAWARACSMAEVKGLHFHDLRRSAVRNMDRAGIPRATIRRIIGHETDSMFDRYRIVDQKDIREAGRKAEEYLQQQPKTKPTSAPPSSN
jgi:integrase